MKPTILSKLPVDFGKKTLTTGLNVLGRIKKTTSVAGLCALRVAKGEKPDAYLLKEAFLQMGVTYIKLGQFIASTPSLFPKEYVLAFSDCLDKTPPIAFSQIRQVLEEELCQNGQCLEDIFESINPISIASASIAQVHEATLKTGQKVALKVQKPDVMAIMQTDLGVLHSAFWILEKIMPAVKAASLEPIIHEMRQRMLAETDFLAESLHIDKFLAYLANTGNTDVTAPYVHKHLSTKRVLTMDLLTGKSLIDNSLPWVNNAEAAKKVMAKVLDTWFLSLMMTGEFHADLHAGNLMMLDNGQIAFLDFGLMGEINPKSLQACFNLVQAIQTSDFYGVAQAMVDIGMTAEHSRMDIDKLAQDLQKIFGANYFNASTQDKDQSVQADSLNIMMVELAQIGKRHGIHFPRDFALLTKQLLYFDRFMVALAPDMELFEGERLSMVQNY